MTVDKIGSLFVSSIDLLTKPHHALTKPQRSSPNLKDPHQIEKYSINTNKMEGIRRNLLYSFPK